MLDCALLILSPSTIGFGQLYSSYTLHGIVNSTGGRIGGKTQIVLNSDSSFLMGRHPINLNKIGGKLIT